MSFGWRDREVWEGVQEDLEGIIENIADEKNVSVRTALEEIYRKKLLTESLVPEQQALWDRLFEAYKLGGADLIRINFQLSGMEIEDLFDLLYVTNELGIYGRHGEYCGFEAALFAFLQNQSSEKMDEVLTGYIDGYPSNVEPLLISLVKSPELIKLRLSELLEMEYDFQTQAVISEGVIKLLGMEKCHTTKRKKVVYIDEHEALIYLQRLMLDESILNNDFINLVQKVQHEPCMDYLMDKIVEWLKNPIHAQDYVGGFDSIGAAVVRKLSVAGLTTVINSKAENLADERLLALYKIKSLPRISDASPQILDASLIELLMENDNESQKNNIQYGKRNKLRKRIKSRKKFRSRLMDIGIIGMFQQVSLTT